jgi:hypothetical protein
MPTCPSKGARICFFVYQSLLGGHLRHGAFEVGRRIVELRLTDSSAADKFFGSVVGEAGQISVCFKRFQLGDVIFICEAHE